MARPRNGLTGATVRQALYHALDRPTFVEVITHGLAPVADSWIAPSDARRPALEASIPRFPYDSARAERLLTQAGWVRGTDGVLAHQPTGERFELTLRASQVGGAQVGKDRELAVVADAWKRVGVEPVLDLQAVGRAGDRGYEAMRPGAALVGNLPPSSIYRGRMHSKFVATEGNRWTGQNLGGYASPNVDALLDQYSVTIDVRERAVLDRQLVQELMGEVALMPLYWEVAPVLMLKGVKSTVVGARTPYKFYEWDKA